MSDPRARPDPDFAAHHAVLIGISRYRQQASIKRVCGKLEEAAGDARRLAETLIEVGYGRQHLRCLLDEEATWEQIRDTLRALQRAPHAALLIVFWAGHAVADAHGQTWLLPHDATLCEGGPPQRAIALATLAGWAGHANVGRVALLLDTCYARPRSPTLDHPGWQGSGLQAVELLIGASTLQAFEDEHGGLLTRCLIDGLRDRAGRADDPAGTVYLEDLADFVRQRLRRSPLLQFPYVRCQPLGALAVGRNPQRKIEHALAHLEPPLPPAAERLARLVLQRRFATPASRRPLVRDLAERLLWLAQERIDRRHYLADQDQLLRRALIAAGREGNLGPWLPRLLDHCLVTDVGLDPIVEHTYRQLVDGGDPRPYLAAMRREFAVKDGLNTVSWSYGVRSRDGENDHGFTHLIRARKAIDPGVEHIRHFRTTVADQRYARLELWTGGGRSTTIDHGCLHFVHRVPLPPGLPAGQLVELGLLRIGDEGLRLRLEVPAVGMRPARRWQAETSDGFRDLALEAAARQRDRAEVAAEPGALVLQTLLEACAGLAADPALPAKVADPLGRWAELAARALVRRDPEVLAEATQMLAGDLRRGRPSSLILVLEALLTLTAAPEAVQTEFRTLARDLLRGRGADEEVQADAAAIAAAFELIAVWRADGSHVGRRASAELGSWLAVLDGVEPLLRSAAEGGGEGAVLGRLTGALDTLLAEHSSLIEAYRQELTSLRIHIEAQHLAGGQRGAHDIRTAELDPAVQTLLQQVFVRAATAFFVLSGARRATFGRFHALVGALRPRYTASELALRAALVDRVETWYQQWLAVADNSVSVLRQIDALRALVRNMESPADRVWGEDHRAASQLGFSSRSETLFKLHFDRESRALVKDEREAGLLVRNIFNAQEPEDKAMVVKYSFDQDRLLEHEAYVREEHQLAFHATSRHRAGEERLRGRDASYHELAADDEPSGIILHNLNEPLMEERGRVRPGETPADEVQELLEAVPEEARVASDEDAAEEKAEGRAAALILQNG